MSGRVFEDDWSFCAHCGQKKARREVVSRTCTRSMSGLEVDEEYSEQAFCLHCAKWGSYHPDVNDEAKIPF